MVFSAVVSISMALLARELRAIWMGPFRVKTFTVK